MHGEEQRYRSAIVGGFLVLAAWKSYLIIRNLLMLNNAPNPPPELELSPETYSIMRRKTAYLSKQLLFITNMDVNIILAKLASDYFPYIWKLSGEYGKTLVSQVVWFTAIDHCSRVLIWLPAAVLSAILTGSNPLIIALQQIIQATIRGAVAALFMYLITYSTGNFGIRRMVELHVGLNALALLAMAIHLQFLMDFDHERLADDETGRAVTAVAKEVGYPVDTIYVDKRTKQPNAHYTSAIFSEAIVITQPLLTSFDAPQVATMFAHELGHWKYYHPLFRYLNQTFNLIATDCLWMMAYGSPTLTRAFHMDPDVHPIIPVYLSFHLIKPLFTDVNDGLFNLISTYCEFIADDYSCGLRSPTTLRAALVKIFSMMESSFLMDQWFAAWFVGHPPILQRIQRIDTRH